MQKLTDNIDILIILGMAGSFLLVVSFILIYVRNQNRMLKQRQQLQFAEITHQKELLQAVIESQETERERIGRDLHDSVGTALSGLRLTIEMFKPEKEQDNWKHVKLSKEIIDKVIQDVRHISHDLSPPILSYYGLAAAVEEKFAIINHSGKLEIDLLNEVPERVAVLPLSVSKALYRVIEELVNNTIKHAGASKAGIKISALDEGGMLIIYNDNGRGMGLNVNRKGMGLQNIESRLGVINATYEMPAGSKGFNMIIKIPA